ncbi:MAG: pyruvate kinase [Ilumatobacteraceae bacterium]
MDGEALHVEVLDLVAEVARLRDALLAAQVEWAPQIASAHPLHRESAANLVHYVELRNHDVRVLQGRLAVLGISSLGRSEAHVMATIDSVLSLLCRLAGSALPDSASHCGFDQGAALLERNTDALLGPPPASRSTRIMVTMPGDATDELTAELARHGMDIARVNCAHDDESAWLQLVQQVRSVDTPDGRRCRLAMDLGGPKLRTGPLQPGPRVVRVAPDRDKLGRIIAPGLAWVTATGVAAPQFEGRTPTAVPVDDPDWVARRQIDDRIAFDDARDAKRSWRVVHLGAGGFVAAVRATTYVRSGLKVTCRTGRSDDVVGIGELAEIDLAHRVGRGDRLVLTRSLEPAVATGIGETHFIGCTLPEAFAAILPQQRAWLDDGKIGCVVDTVDDDHIWTTVTDVRPGGANLRAGKGINLPDTDLSLAALTAKDIEDLSFVAQHADIVNFSFVRSEEDVHQLQDELQRRDAGRLGIVLKIENVSAFENLPSLLLAAMRSEVVGVMIARGDLAVEVGFERLAEVQEEIMWACEAAHIPVIWATQVLDTLARTGHASRAEVTDAAMAVRAECAMLNKGPHITDAIAVLDSILTRMQSHQQKKRSLLRRLHAWERPGS